MNILSIKNLSFNYPNNKILKDINIHVDKGEVVSILGGSGVGKTTLFNIIAGINPLQSGEISIKGNTDYKGRVSYMLQKDLLLEHKTIIQNIILPLLIRKINKKEAEEEAIKNLKLFNLYEYKDKYPSELSGGMRQRVCIAMAVAGRPKILICDEPTTALDITTEAQILRLMQTLAVEAGIGIIFISHNLRVIAQICDRVMVMYAGKCVESATVEGIFNEPRHPYTLGLLLALPQGKWHGELKAVEGQPPDLFDLPRGCAFNPRCKWAMRICGNRIPMVTNVGEGHQFTCWLAKLEGL